MNTWLSSTSNESSSQDGVSLENSLKENSSPIKKVSSPGLKGNQIQKAAPTKESSKENFFLPKSIKKRKQMDNFENHSEKELTNYAAKLAANNIDPLVWNGLPEELRFSLLKELDEESQPHRHTKKARGITSFFKPVALKK